MIRALAFALILFVSGCSLGKRDDAVPAATAAQRFATTLDSERIAKAAQAFRVTAWPLLRRDCATCHASQQVPKIADEKVMPAFYAAFGQVKWEALETSRLVERSKDDHCKNSVCRTDGKLMTEALKAWKDKWDHATPETLEKNEVRFASHAQAAN